MEFLAWSLGAVLRIDYNAAWMQECKSACSAAQLCLTLCSPMDCSPPGSSVHGVFQAKVLEWVAISYSRRSSGPRDWTWVFCASYVASRFFTTVPPGKPKSIRGESYGGGSVQGDRIVEVVIWVCSWEIFLKLSWKKLLLNWVQAT